MSRARMATGLQAFAPFPSALLQDKPCLYSCFALLRIAAFPLACHSAFTPAKPLQKPLNNPLLGASVGISLLFLVAFALNPNHIC